METRSLLHDVADRAADWLDALAEGLRDAGFDLLHEDLNQVLVACEDDDATDGTLAAVQADGTCYPSGTTWHGRRCIRAPPPPQMAGTGRAGRGVGARNA